MNTGKPLYEICAICDGTGKLKDKSDCPVCETIRAAPIGLSTAQVERAFNELKELKNTSPPTSRERTDYDISFTKRDLDEIRLCLHYALGSNHGTDGHHKANVIAKLAIELYRMSDDRSIIWKFISYEKHTMHSRLVEEAEDKDIYG